MDQIDLERKWAIDKLIPSSKGHVVAHLSQLHLLDNGEVCDYIVMSRAYSLKIAHEGKPAQVVTFYFLHGLENDGICLYEFSTLLSADAEFVRFIETHLKKYAGGRGGRPMHYDLENSDPARLATLGEKFDLLLEKSSRSKHKLHLPKDHTLNRVASIQAFSLS